MAKKKRTRRKLDSIAILAIHEAGHAVMQTVLRLGLKKVTIVTDHDSAGHSIHGGEWGDADAEDLRITAESEFWLRHAVARFAGAYACKRAGEPEWAAGADNDFHWAVDAIERITCDADSIDALIPLAKRRCEVLVEHYWPEITAVAAELQRRKSAAGAKVKAIVMASLLKRHAGLRKW